jgi:hypothetical protein
MWGIYSKAERVVVWLGEEQDNSSLGKEMVRLLSLHLRSKFQKALRDRAGLSKKAESILEDLGIASGIGKERDEKERQPVWTNSVVKVRKRSSVEEESLRMLERMIKDNDHNDETVQGGSKKSGTVNFIDTIDQLQWSQDPPDLYNSTRPRAQSFDDIKGDRMEVNLDRSGPSPTTVLSEADESSIPLDLIMGLHGSADGSHIDSQDPEEWVAFQMLMKRPWWRRIWVVQEIAASSELNLGGMRNALANMANLPRSCSDYWNLRGSSLLPKAS